MRKKEPIFIVSQHGQDPIAFGSIQAIFDELGENVIGTPIHKAWGNIDYNKPYKYKDLYISKTDIKRRKQNDKQ